MSHMGKKRVQSRVDPDTHDRIEEFRDTNNLSDSEAVRRLIRAGLEKKGYTDDQTNQGVFERIARPFTVALGFVLLNLSVALYAGAAVSPAMGATVALVAVGTWLSIIGIVALTGAAAAQTHIGEPLRDLVRISEVRR
jgi:hypothetical protein